MMLLAAALSCAVIQEGDFLQGVRDGGLSPEAAESFPWLVGLANRLRETPVDPPTSPEPAAAGASDVTDPSIEPSAPKRLRTCAKELPAFLMEWEDPECEGRPPPAYEAEEEDENGVCDGNNSCGVEEDPEDDVEYAEDEEAEEFDEEEFFENEDRGDEEEEGDDSGDGLCGNQPVRQVHPTILH